MLRIVSTLVIALLIGLSGQTHAQSSECFDTIRAAIPPEEVSGRTVEELATSFKQLACNETRRTKRKTSKATALIDGGKYGFSDVGFEEKRAKYCQAIDSKLNYMVLAEAYATDTKNVVEALRVCASQSTQVSKPDYKASKKALIVSFERKVAGPQLVKDVEIVGAKCPNLDKLIPRTLNAQERLEFQCSFDPSHGASFIFRTDAGDQTLIVPYARKMNVARATMIPVEGGKMASQCAPICNGYGPRSRARCTTVVTLVAAQGEYLAEPHARCTEARKCARSKHMTVSIADRGHVTSVSATFSSKRKPVEGCVYARRYVMRHEAGVEFEVGAEFIPIPKGVDLLTDEAGLSYELSNTDVFEIGNGTMRLAN